MRILDLDIERFGVWHGLRFDLPRDQITVLYGRNEAGKSTLLRFICEVMYGFEAPKPDDLELYDSGAAGSLLVQTRRGVERLRRAAVIDFDPEMRPSVRAVETPAAEIQSAVLQGVPSRVFRNVFAIELGELQEFATLSGGDVAEHVFGLSLGPCGRRLLDACDAATANIRSLHNPRESSGRLVDLFNRLDRFDADDARRKRRRSQYTALCDRRESVEERLSELRRRQRNVLDNARGLEYLSRVWKPWKRDREIGSELQRIPVVPSFPENGVARLNKIAADAAAAQSARDRVLNDIRQSRQQLTATTAPEDLRRHAASMRGFVDQADWLRDLQTRLAEAVRQVDAADDECHQAVRQLGSDWTTSRIAAIDASPEAHQRLAALERECRTASDAVDAARQRVSRISQLRRKLQLQIEAKQPLLAGGTLAEALDSAKQQRDQFHKLAELQLMERELIERQISIEDHTARIAPRAALPDWMYNVLAIFGLVGAVLSIWGVYTGYTHSTLAGAMYALLGLTCSLLGLGLKYQFEGDAIEAMRAAGRDAAKNQSQLDETREKIRRLTGSPGQRTDQQPLTTQHPVTTESEENLAQLFEARSNLSANPPTHTEQPMNDSSEYDAPPGAMHEDLWMIDDEESSQRPEAQRPAAGGRQSTRVSSTASGRNGEADRKEPLVGAHHTLAGSTTPPVVAEMTGFERRMDESLQKLDVTAVRWRTSAERFFDSLRTPRSAEAASWETRAQDRIDASRRTAARYSKPAAAPVDLDMLRDVNARILELEGMRRKQRRLRIVRRKLSASRQEFESCNTRRHEVESQRRRWMDEHGLSDGDFSTAHDFWRKLLAAQDKLRIADVARSAVSPLQRVFDGYRHRLGELARQTTSVALGVNASPEAILNGWRSGLDRLSGVRRQRLEHRKKIAARRKEARELGRQIDDLRLQRNALLAQGQSSTREEFEARADSYSRRLALEAEQSRLRAETAALQAEYSGIALAEEQLVRFNPAEHAAATQRLRKESSEIDFEIQHELENRGAIRNEIERLERDEQPADAEFTRQRVLDELAEAAVDWFVSQTQARVVGEMRSRYERRRQPAALAAAAKYLSRLTSGRYVNVWSPLGERTLKVDDSRGRTLGVDQLSRGAREQLLIAVRLAVADQFAAAGIELPLVLDDVLVNFDALRTATAVDLLTELAADGRQVLFFTCHEHLVSMFENGGVRVLRLPNREAGDGFLSVTHEEPAAVVVPIHKPIAEPEPTIVPFEQPTIVPFPKEEPAAVKSPEPLFEPEPVVERRLDAPEPPPPALGITIYAVPASAYEDTVPLDM